MDNFTIGTISILVSNTLLSSYPILIKSYIADVGIMTQLIIRCIVYIFLCVPFILIGNESVQLFSTLVQPKFLFISIINLIHIYTSYRGFELLNPGVALTTFYTYPIVQLFLSKFILKSAFDYDILYNLFGSLIGLIVLNKDLFDGSSNSSTSSNNNNSSNSSNSSNNSNSSTSSNNSNNSNNSSNKKLLYTGLGFIGIAALTEAIINVFYKGADMKNPFMSLYTLYAPAFFVYIAYMLYKRNEEVKKLVSIEGSTMKKIVLFNVAIGGIGYAMRLFGLTKVPMSWFSTLSFTNGISVFLLAWFILGDRIKLNHVIGSAIIFYNIDKIKKLV
jgi:drug/metabolite transporter (DMT)-like permease